MTRLADRLGPYSLVLALLGIITALPLASRWGAPLWVTPVLGAVAAAAAWPAVRKKATISTVSNRSMSVAGLVLGLVAIGLGALLLASDALWPSS
ncbi:hypothetical protein [Nonomuraea jiangxiensis]|uniref:Uncharacterized protein n=1 Tax=Nonomuraea jiangxiensis TaxID=633440 RepID=A0A1G9UXP7_9ACTN|nr:hypothetical protein [Nonomuraea jiangxiensis]SDM64577.1 hypothetical protein SAMN05421869_15040 [Nonomuraea jiangxiensis]